MSRAKVTYDSDARELRLQFDEGEVWRHAALDCVVDFTGDGRIIGIEILNFKRQAAAIAPPIVREPTIRSTYDAEVDAFGVTFARENSLEQRRESAEALIGHHGELLALIVTTAASGVGF